MNDTSEDHKPLIVTGSVPAVASAISRHAPFLTAAGQVITFSREDTVPECSHEPY